MLLFGGGQCLSAMVLVTRKQKETEIGGAATELAKKDIVTAPFIDVEVSSFQEHKASFDNLAM